MKNTRLLLIFILALAAVGLAAQDALVKFVDTTIATYNLVNPEYQALNGGTAYPGGAGNLTNRWEVKGYLSTDATIDPLDTAGMPTGDDTYLLSKPLNFSPAATRALNLDAFAVPSASFPCYVYIRVFNAIQGSPATKTMTVLGPYSVTAGGPVNVPIITQLGGWGPWVLINDVVVPTYTVTMTTNPVGTINGNATPYVLGPTEDPTALYGTYTPDPLPAPATGYWTPVNLVIDAATVWTPDGDNFVLNQEFVWTEVTSYVYNLYVNGPDGYAVTGPMPGVTDYMATYYDVAMLVGDYTIAAPPAGYYWAVNPITVTADMFTLVPGGKGLGQRSTGAKEVLTYAATIEFVLACDEYTVSIGASTPPGAAIWFNGVDTGFTAPHDFTGCDVLGTYTLKYPGYYDLDLIADPANLVFPNPVMTEIPAADTWTLTVQSLPTQGHAIYKNGVACGFVTDHSCTTNDVTELYGTYTLEPVAGHYWDPAQYVIDASTVWDAKVAYSKTIVFNLLPCEDEFILEVNAFDGVWYDITMGYEQGDITPPLNIPAHNDPNDLGAEIWYADVTYTIVGSTGKYTPYTFGDHCDPQGYMPFELGYYWVQDPCYVDWQPATLNVLQTITHDYRQDYLGYGCVPVELSSFTATLTAQNYVQLTWVSQTESQMMGYLVYRNTTADQSTAILIDQPMVAATNTSTAQTYSITDNDVQIGTTYYYWLEAVDYAASTYHGPVSVVVQGEVPPVLPQVTSMSNAYPNPFKANSNTNIDVNLKAGENGTVTIYNVLGQTVRSFQVNEGSHTINWNGRDSKGNACGSGIYFYKLSTPSMNVTKKMVIVK